MIVEDGTGLTNSNSYASIAEANTYASDRNLTAWAGTDAEKSAALIRATDHLDRSFIYRSVRASDDQALECPRYGDTAINPKLKAATIELAIIALTTDLTAPPERGIVAETITAGRVSTSTTYDAATTSTDPYPSITKLLRALASRVGSTVQVGMMTR